MWFFVAQILLVSDYAISIMLELSLFNMYLIIVDYYE